MSCITMSSTCFDVIHLIKARRPFFFFLLLSLTIHVFLFEVRPNSRTFWIHTSTPPWLVLFFPLLDRCCNDRWKIKVNRLDVDDLPNLLFYLFLILIFLHSGGVL